MHMETLFDHKPTTGEIRNLFGYSMTRAEYETPALDENTANADLARLFDSRGKDPKPFLDRIMDEQYKFNLQLVDVAH